MCTGVEIAMALGSAALSGVGSAINQREQQKNNERMAAARNAELEQTRQKNRQLSQQATEIFDQRLAQMSPEQQQQQSSQTENARIGELLTAANEAPAVDTPVSGSAPQLVQAENAKRLGEALTRSKSNATRLGTLGMYNQNMFDNNLATAQAGQKISVPVGFAQSNAQMLPYYQDLAEISASKPMSGIGSLLQAAGQVGGYYAGSGKMGAKAKV